MVPPPLELLKEPLLSYINFFQNQLTISYPSMTFLNSPEAERYPILRDIVKLMLRVIEDKSSCGPSGANILRMWLGFMNDDMRNGFNPMVMLQDEEIRKVLYARGMVNFDPPELSLRQSFDNFKVCTLEERFYKLTIPGHERGLIVATSGPVSEAWLSCSFDVKAENSETSHELSIMLGPANMSTPPIINSVPANMQSLKVLIFNASGVSNPEFIYTFAETCFEHEPHLVVITETRLGGPQGIYARSSMNYPATAGIEPSGYFGGAWLLWNPANLNIAIVSLDDDVHALTARINSPA